MLGSCTGAPLDARELRVAEAFIDAFYSFDRDRLAALVAPGREADAVLYYQAWAEAAHYRVLTRRPCGVSSSGSIACAITVTDDFGSALGYLATDAFTLRVAGEKVVAVTLAGDDPPVFEQLFAWLEETRPELFSGPCKGLFAGGTTPGDCARAVAQGARDFAARRVP